MDLYKNKFRIASTRLKEWDYSTPSWYYVTICTKFMKHWFGEIKNDEMVLNDAGKIVETLWNTIPDHYKNVELDEFVIMPNHIHGIIILGSVETGHAPSLLGNVVGSFKSAVSKYLRGKMNLEFNWQPRFYDHIIRNENDLLRIRTYIKNNPLKWELDKYYSKE
ncbi:MAG: transposase [Ignavibacteriales bacterium]|nr:MAG: transposase [Ignavibacteriales bacterium]